MKILHVIPTYLPARRYGGPIVAVHGLCQALVRRGHEVDVFTTNVDGDGVLDVPSGAPVEMDGVRVHYFGSSWPRLYWSSAMADFMSRRARDYHVVHTHAVYLWPGLAASRAAARARVPYIISPRGMLVPELIRQKSRLVKSAWLAVIERRRFAGAAGIHFTSNLEWTDARRVGVPLPRPFVVPNGLDVDPRPAVRRDDRTLVFLGRITWKKGLDIAIQTLARLDGVRLLIAGNDEEGLTPRLVELARQCGVADRVTFLGAVYGESRNELLASATLFILLSRSENFGNAVLEAMAMETPVVVTPEVGLADSVDAAKAGLVVSSDFASAIGALLSDGSLRSVMGGNGRALVTSRFAWPRVAAEMEAAYLERDAQTARHDGRP